jgi:hypothetical protein
MPEVKRTYVVALLATCVGAWLLLLRHAGPDVPKPSFSCVKVEPAEVLNREGADTWLVTFCISNVNTGPLAPEKFVFVRQTSGAVECRKSGFWAKDDEAFPIPLDCGLGPGKTCERLLLVPTGAESCRVAVTFTDGTLLLRARIGRIAQSLPLLIRQRFPYGFWRWAGFIQTVPSRSWREAEIAFDLNGVSPGTQLVH